ncbi:MAG TPA: hypothetical protein GXX17_04765 [Clostridiales bacterium]|nr:hypothetical protein [Clostridiales bacterium]
MDRAIYRLRNLKERFTEVLYRDRNYAAQVLNHSTVPFALLYVSIPEIEAYNLYEKLNHRNKYAYDFCSEIAGGSSNFKQEKSPREKEIIRWIFRSGIVYDGLDSRFDRIIDVAAAVLIRQFNDLTILKPAIDIVFRRNKKGSFNHDLIWAVFSAHRPEVLKFIAEYLLSPDVRDRQLACRLLNIGFDNGQDNRTAYKKFISWLNENIKYINVGDFCQQLTSNPATYEVSLENKYLCKSVSNNLVTVDEEEKIRQFANLDDETKQMLCNYSNRLYRANRAQWRKWISLPLYRQIESTRRGGYE